MLMRRPGLFHAWVNRYQPLGTVSILSAAACRMAMAFILFLSLQDTDLLASFSVEGDKLMIDAKLDK